MKLFGTDGIRGKAGVKLNAECALKLGIAAGIYFRKKHSKLHRILVGKDTRRSGYMIENALVSGLTATGCNVIQIGPMPTPAISYLTEDMRCDAGIMISASHNTYEDNGIKFFEHNGTKLSLQSEQEIEDIYYDSEKLALGQKTDKEIGNSKRIDDIIGRYIAHIKNSFPKELSLSGLRIVVDAANGAGYKVAPTIFSELGAEVFMINDEPNGFNINDNCGATSPKSLALEVQRVRADIGIALDGDADRVLIVDEKGEIVNGDKLIGSLALHLKQKKMLREKAIVTTIMSNMGLEEFLKKEGIKLHRSDVGDKFVLDEMNKLNINFGGEQSGHIIFGDFSKTGDGIISALQTLVFMIENGGVASKALNLFDLYPQKLVNLPISHKIPFEKMTGFDVLNKMLDESKIRSLIRYSGTENKLRILLEHKNEQILESKMQECIEFFEKKLAQ